MGTTVTSQALASDGPGADQEIRVRRAPVIRHEPPNSAWPAVAPRVTTTRGFSRASSAASHGQQARTCRLSGLLRHRSFAGGMLLALFYFGGFTSLFFILSILWQEGLGRSALDTGLLVLPFALAFLVSAANSSRFSTRFGRKTVLAGISAMFAGQAVTLAVLHLTVPRPREWYSAPSVPRRIGEKARTRRGGPLRTLPQQAARLGETVAPAWPIEAVRPRKAPVPWGAMIRAAVAICTPSPLAWSSTTWALALLPAQRPAADECSAQHRVAPFFMQQNELCDLGQQLRVDAVRAAATAGSGHPTSSMSAADLMAVLLAGHLRYDFGAPDCPGNDHLIFSKGHASPLLYAMYRAAGAINDRELLSFRKLGSRLEGHPTPRLPWVDVATGSLGLGLPAGVGMALSGRRLEHLDYRVWVLCGDSELAEGSMWEAFEHAGYEGLANLTAIIDVNRLGQRGQTRHGWDTAAYARRISAFGWHTIEIDGHDVAVIDRAYAAAAATRDRPTAIIARTMKGRGVASVHNAEGAHGKPLPDAEAAIAELGGIRNITVPVHPPVAAEAPLRPGGAAGQPDLPRYKMGEKVATRTAFGEALVALGGARQDLVVLDGEVADSTRTDAFAKAYPDRFFECYIAEQEMIGAALGLQARGWVPVAATFAAFWTRAHDFIRMAAIGRANLKLAGSHAGVSIGEDGPSQMGLEDLAMFRPLHGSVVLYPCDANQTAALAAELAAHHGIGYLRTTRGNTPVIYAPGEQFPVGGSKVLRSGNTDRVTIIAAGVTVHEALAAADALAADGIAARVIDVYSVKPVDTQTLREAAEVTEHFVTVEDHCPEGGLGDAVLAAFANGHRPPAVTKLAVHTMPGSATPEEQLHAAGIDAKAIEAAVRALLDTGEMT